MLWNVLQAIRRQITEKLGLSSSKSNTDTNTAPISNSQLDFLLQVLQATADSDGDAKVIHPLLEANQEKLDMNFAQILRSWAMATLSDLEIDTAQNTLIDILNFSNRMQDFPLGNRRNNLEIAITGYEIALTVFTQDRFPEKWAMTQNNLGTAYRNRIQGEKADNLEIAISCYQKALLERTRDRFPFEWATTQNNLGNAYSNRIRGERADNLEVAIKCYQDSLLEYTRDRFPDEWAMTQNNLGLAYSKRIRGERADNLEIAIKCLQDVLLEYTRDRFPYEWARTQNNLGNAYSDRIRGEKADNLELAIKCYQDSLPEYTRDRFPYEWANTQNNLGNAYLYRIRGEKADNLEVAIKCYQDVLPEYTRDRFPYEWANTQNNLGNAYSDRIRGERADNLELAIKCYQDALLEYTRQALPQNHATTASNLGLAYVDAKRFADAYNIFKSAIDTVEFLRGEIFSGDEIKQKLAEEWNQLYSYMVEVCLELKYDDQAVEYIERSKTRNLVELLANQGSPALHQLQQQIAEEKRRLAAADNSEPTSLNQLRQQRQELIKQVIPLEHIRFAEIQRLLDNHTAILQWYIFNDCFRTFIITSENQTPRIWKSTAEDLEALDNWTNEYLETYYTEKDRWRHQLAAKLQELADILHINDVLDLVPNTCNAVILVPHRYLHLLPLHALPLDSVFSAPTEVLIGGSRRSNFSLRFKNNLFNHRDTEDAERESYLLDRFPNGVRYAPSCQLLKFAQKREYQPQQSLFAIQDPSDNLIYTNMEVEAIQRNFHPTTVLKKAQATKQALLQAVANSPDVQVIHLSCHGYFDIESPVNSAIALADCVSSTLPASNRQRELADGNTLDLEKCLTLVDIFNLNLPECRLVTLSACETGLTSPRSTSDEYIGLASGFLKAGSSSVVSSLWSVDDFATALLMIRFYDNLPTLPIAQALREAQHWLRNATQPDLIKWTEQHPNINEENKQTIQHRLEKHYGCENSNDQPFGKPAAWAGFCAIGH
ncbi:CHAT domain-containing protein [aff. Roholtiella sp. LEGE 12411]|uniref:CHAT domain-containing protein n=1 Tax=aff. Roholtiella sp. LEGE 12411 TaxID=1828822 RepID=UPI00187F984B|nr:CHAT domain-containing protein [aff. Roholtiella sp. LEGE 12411]MBE9036812.1 CHAT domain-containing protein [aff. Roholtiella sp. LEGE 12411]